MNTASPFSRPLYIMAKPAGSLCNMRCEYCYYLEKDKMYSGSDAEDVSVRGGSTASPTSAGHFMSDELLEKFIREYINSQTTREVLFTWHGGETLLRPLSFYQRVVELQRQYAGDHLIDNCIQTNATLINDAWCRFFKQNGWLVGVSIDGPQEFHDEFRRMKGGGPSWAKVMHGIQLLNRHGVEWNALAVVNDFNADYPLDFYRFFKSIGCRYIQFTPVVERTFAHADGRQLAAVHEGDASTVTDFSVTPEQWGNFLIAIFDEWVRHDVGEYYVQLFDATLSNWMGMMPGICTLAKTCGHAGAMEWNGDVYSCDHFVFPEYLLGNLHTHSFLEMMQSERQLAFGNAKQAALPRRCKECKWLFACNGECPRNRFCRTPEGEGGWNYLCEGYRRFFAHAAPFMDYMKDQLLSEQAPANIMQALRDGTFNPET